MTTQNILCTSHGGLDPGKLKHLEPGFEKHFFGLATASSSHDTASSGVSGFPSPNTLSTCQPLVGFAYVMNYYNLLYNVFSQTDL